MDREFWQERWERNEIGFHKQEVNPLLKAHVGHLGLAPGSHVLVPLCGKSLDLLWLLQNGFRVTGIELSEKAVEDFFTENGLEFERQSDAHGTAYRHGGLTLWCADVFHFDAGLLDRVDAVYDRAALVALPARMRRDYVSWLFTVLADETPLLLVALHYPQDEMPGPPFSVAPEEVRGLFGKRARITTIHSQDVLAAELRWREKGISHMDEQVYLILTGNRISTA